MIKSDGVKLMERVCQGADGIKLDRKTRSLVSTLSIYELVLLAENKKK